METGKWAVRNRDIPDEFRMFTDLWEYRKKYYCLDDTSAYWQSVVNEAHSLSGKYNSDYFNTLLVATIDDWEKLAKAMRAGGGKGLKDATARLEGDAGRATRRKEK